MVHATSTGSFAQGFIADKLGIGTTNPVYALVVNAGNDMTAHFKNDGDRARLMLSDNDTDGFLIVQNSKMSVGLNNTVHANNLTLLDGSVGIGTTSPSNKLTVEDTIGIKRSGVNAITTLQMAGSGLIVNGANGYHPLIVQANGTEIFRVKNDGNISGSATSTGSFGDGRIANKLGIGTTSPTQKLHIGSRGTASDPATTASDGLVFDFYNAGNPYPRKGSIISNSADASESKLAFWTAAASSTITEKMSILGNGNVGIGETTPQNKLEVATSNSTYSHFGAIATTDGHYTGISLGYREDNLSYRKTAIVQAQIGDGAARGHLHFLVDTAADGNSVVIGDSKMMIHGTSGNVGIGTTNPEQLLHVEGNAALSLLESTGAGQNSEFQFKTTARIFGIGQNIGTTGKFEIYDRTAGSTRLAVDSSGNVGIGVVAPEGKLHILNGDASIAPHADADELVVENSANAGISILSGNTSNGAIIFGDAQDANVGIIDYDHANNQMSFTVGATKALTIDAGANTKITDGKALSTTTFISGIAGDGFRIIDNGGDGVSMEIDNIMVRKTLRTHIFQKDTVKATNGILMVTDAAVISGSTSTDNDTSTVTFIDEKSATFSAGDRVWFKDADEATGTINSVQFTITASGVTAGSGFTKYGVSSASGSLSDLTGSIGGTAVRISGGSIVLDASSADSPFMDVMAGSGSGVAGNTKVRLGNLAGITSPRFGTLGGFGLWASGSAYLEGVINAKSGNIGGWGIGATAISSSGGIVDIDAGVKRITIRSDATTDRVYLGEIADDDDYGLKIFDGTGTDDADLLVELGSNQNMIAGWDLTPGNIVSDNAGGSVRLSSTEQALTIWTGSVDEAQPKLVLGKLPLNDGTVNEPYGFAVFSGAGTVSGSEASASVLITANKARLAGWELIPGRLSSGTVADINGNKASIALGTGATTATGTPTDGLFFVSASTKPVFYVGSSFSYVDDVLTAAGWKVAANEISASTGTVRLISGAGGALALGSTPPTSHVSGNGAWISGSGQFLFGSSSGEKISFDGSNLIMSSSTFFLGGGSQFVSGSNGNIEISSSNFHLQPDGDVIMSGEITAEAGNIGGFTISDSSIEATNIKISSTAASMSLGGKIEVAGGTDSYIAGGAHYGDPFGNAFDNDNLGFVLGLDSDVVKFEVSKDENEFLRFSSGGGLAIGASTFTLETSKMKLASGTNNGKIALGATPPTAITNNKGFYADGNGTVLIGDADGSRISFDNTNLVMSASTFFLGSSGQFLSGSNGNIEISSSNFHLQPDGDVVMSGTVTAAAGAIGGFTIANNQLSGSSTALIATNVGNDRIEIRGSDNTIAFFEGTKSSSKILDMGKFSSVQYDSSSDRINSYGLSVSGSVTPFGNNKAGIRVTNPDVAEGINFGAVTEFYQSTHTNIFSRISLGTRTDVMHGRPAIYGEVNSQLASAPGTGGIISGVTGRIIEGTSGRWDISAGVVGISSAEAMTSDGGGVADGVFGVASIGDAYVKGDLTATGTITGDLTGDVTGDVTGNADTATLATNVTVVNASTIDATHYLTFVDGSSGTQGIEIDTQLTYNPFSNTLAVAGTTTIGGGYGSTGITLATDGDLSMNGDLKVDGLIHLASSTTAEPIIKIENTNADATAGSIQFVKNGHGEADNDVLGSIDFKGDDSGNVETLYAQIIGKSGDITNLSEDGDIVFKVAQAGTMRTVMHMDGVNEDVLVHNDLYVTGAEPTDGAIGTHYFRIHNNNSANYIDYGGGNVYFRDDGGNTTMFFENTTRDVGIGTTAPTARLHVADTTANQQLLKVKGAGDNNTALVKFNHSEASLETDDTILDLDFDDDQSIGSDNHYIFFQNQDGQVGSINSEVVYSTFTGGHISQRPSGSSYDDWKPGMIVKSTGEIINLPNKASGSLSMAWPVVDITTSQKNKAVMGVFVSLSTAPVDKEGYTTGSKDPGVGRVSGLDDNAPHINYNAVGEGKILVTDTNGNIETGDYICSSVRTGHGEKQDDDLLHNYTVAKATQPYNFASTSNDSDLGYKSVLIACTYHCG